MLKTVFIDYTGTIIREDGPASMEMVKRCYMNSDAKSPQEALSYWWENLKKYEEAAYLDDFITEDEIVDKLLDQFEGELNLKDNKEELHGLCNELWSKSPVFDDVKEFFETCPLPIYVVTNNGAEYVQVAMDDNGLAPAGIVCGDMARAYKPHKELFEKALEISGCTVGEVIHVGDSVSSDVKGAQNAGIRPILLDRTGEKVVPGVTVIKSLTELIEMIGTGDITGML